MNIKEQFKKFLDDNFLFDTSNLIADEKERNYRKENSPVWLAFKSAYELQKAEITRLNEVVKQNEVDLHKYYNDKLSRFGNPKIGNIYCTVGNYAYQLQVLDAYPTENGMSIKVDAIGEITRLQKQNEVMREALVIAKGLLDAMKWSNEEPHEGSYGWIINQALSEEK